MPNNADNSRTPPQLTEYEQRLLDSLRAERRGRLGMAAVPIAPVEPPESESGENLEAPVLAAQVTEPIPLPKPEPDVAPAPQVAVMREMASNFAADAMPKHVPPPRRYVLPKPVPKDNRLRLWLILAAGPVAIFAAVYMIVAFNGHRIAPPSSDGAEVAQQSSQSERTADTPAAHAPARVPAPANGPFDKLITETGGADSVEPVASLEELFRDQLRQPAGGATFRAAMLKSAPESPARLSYLEVAGERVRLRSAAAESGAVTLTLRAGAYVRVQERSVADGWCRVRVAEGQVGWMKCEFLKPIAEFGKQSVPPETSK